MFALFAAWYNFYRKHQSIKTTPAVAAGIASETWTLEKRLTESAKSMALQSATTEESLWPKSALWS